MKCIKCGYFSFDYLSECKKCRASLTQVRQLLGFSGLRPEVPEMLTSLLRNYAPPPAQEAAVAEPSISASLDFEDGLEMAPHEAVEETPEVIAAPAVDVRDEAEEDFSLLDLSDEELELLIETPSDSAEAAAPAAAPLQDTGEADFVIPDSLSPDEPVFPAMKIELPKEEEHAAEAEDGGLELIFDADDLPPELEEEHAAEDEDEGLELTLDADDFAPEPKEEPKAAAAATPDPILSADVPDLDGEPEEALPEFSQPPKKGGILPGEPGDDYVFELSEEDLDNLLVELSHPKPGPETERKGLQDDRGAK